MTRVAVCVAVRVAVCVAESGAVCAAVHIYLYLTDIGILDSNMTCVEMCVAEHVAGCVAVRVAGCAAVYVVSCVIERGGVCVCVALCDAVCVAVCVALCGRVVPRYRVIECLIFVGF